MAYFSAPIDSNPEQEKQPSRGGAASQRPNKKRQRRAASAPGCQRAEDHCRVERDDAPPEPLEV